MRTKVNTGAFIQEKLVQNKDIKIGSPHSSANRLVVSTVTIFAKDPFFCCLQRRESQLALWSGIWMLERPIKKNPSTKNSMHV